MPNTASRWQPDHEIGNHLDYLHEREIRRERGEGKNAVTRVYYSRIPEGATVADGTQVYTVLRDDVPRTEWKQQGGLRGGPDPYDQYRRTCDSGPGSGWTYRTVNDALAGAKDQVETQARRQRRDQLEETAGAAAELGNQPPYDRAVPRWTGVGPTLLHRPRPRGGDGESASPPAGRRSADPLGGVDPLARQRPSGPAWPTRSRPRCAAAWRSAAMPCQWAEISRSRVGGACSAGAAGLGGTSFLGPRLVGASERDRGPAVFLDSVVLQEVVLGEQLAQVHGLGVSGRAEEAGQTGPGDC